MVPGDGSVFVLCVLFVLFLFSCVPVVYVVVACCVFLFLSVVYMPCFCFVS